MTDALQDLFETIESRRGDDPTTSYSAKLLSEGPAKIGQKISEEAVEVLVAAMQETPERVVSESADVLYHLVALWVHAGIRPDDVWAELDRRSGTSGIAEKAARPK